MALPVLRTRHLLLRPWALDDLDVLHALWTTPDVRRYLWDDLVIDRAVAEQVVRSGLQTAEEHGIGYWAVHVGTQLSSSGTHPVDGFCGFRFIDDSRNIEIMYGFDVAHWGRGYATEACLAALDYLWRCTSFAVVYARTDPPNDRSVRVMRRLGMIHESTTATMITYLLRRTETAEPGPEPDRAE
jgi:ribosomal-protein-alanine N-acetyltransferase